MMTVLIRDRRADLLRMIAAGPLPLPESELRERYVCDSTLGEFRADLKALTSKGLLSRSLAKTPGPRGRRGRHWKVWYYNLSPAEVHHAGEIARIDASHQSDLERPHWSDEYAERQQEILLRKRGLPRPGVCR